MTPPVRIRVPATAPRHGIGLERADGALTVFVFDENPGAGNDDIKACRSLRCATSRASP
jgi:hypothetical protein